MEIDEVVLRSDRCRREPMPFERFKFFCWFIAGIIGEVLGFILLLVIVLEMGGVLR